MNDTEKRLQHLFRQLRQREAEGADGPPFAKIWARALSRSVATKRQPAWGRRLALATVAVAIVAAVFLMYTPRTQQQRSDEPSVLAEWRSPTAFLMNYPLPDASVAAVKAPTDFLLDLSGRDFLRTLPRVGVSKWSL